VGSGEVPPGEVLAAHLSNLRDLEAVAAREEASFAPLAARLAPAPVVRVPFLSSDVSDLGGLAQIATYLDAQALTPFGR
jgi:hypothetical protein